MWAERKNSACLNPAVHEITSGLQRAQLSVIEQRCIKNLLPVRIRVESVLAVDEESFPILRVHANILQVLLRTDEKLLLKLWAGREASILSN